MAVTGTDHECYTEAQLEELMSLRAKYFLLAWEQLAEAYPQCFSQEVYRLLVPEVVEASSLKRSACSSMTVWWRHSTNRLP